MAVTSGNVNDGRAGPSALPAVVGEVFADSAYRGPHFAAAVRARGGVPRIVATHMWCHADADGPALLRAINGPIQRVRGRIEKIFGTCKRSYGLRRMRWRGLAKAGLQVRLTAMAHNLRRTLTILQERCARRGWIRSLLSLFQAQGRDYQPNRRQNNKSILPCRNLNGNCSSCSVAGVVIALGTVAWGLGLTVCLLRDSTLAWLSRRFPI